MKKVMGIFAAIMVACGLMISTTGCDVEPEQIKVIAQNAGMFSAVGWIALDNPSTNEMAAVKSVLSVVKDKSSDVKQGSTYSEVIFPELIKVIDTEMESQYRPIAKAGALSILGGIDMLFATHPEWKKDQDLAIQIVASFIMGAENGLGLSERHPAIIQARATAARRARIFNN
jgi:hypothetical protein